MGLTGHHGLWLESTFWREIRALRFREDTTWIISGDLNMVRFIDKR